jgi:hypothetical protein
MTRRSGSWIRLVQQMGEQHAQDREDRQELIVTAVSRRVRHGGCSIVSVRWETKASAHATAAELGS